MKILEELMRIKKMVEKSGSYVGSSTSRESIVSFYKNTWLPISEDFRKKLLTARTCEKFELTTMDWLETPIEFN